MCSDIFRDGIAILHQHQLMRVSGDQLSGKFQVTNGVRQDGVFSPCFLKVYMLINFSANQILDKNRSHNHTFCAI